MIAEVCCWLAGTHPQDTQQWSMAYLWLSRPRLHKSPTQSLQDYFHLDTHFLISFSLQSRHGAPNPKKDAKRKMFILDILRVVGPVLLQAHSWVWLTQGVKALQNNSCQRVGLGEHGPAVAWCGHSQKGSRRGEKGPSGSKEETEIRVGKKGNSGMSTRGDQREEISEGVLLSFRSRGTSLFF